MLQEALGRRSDVVGPVALGRVGDGLVQDELERLELGVRVLETQRGRVGDLEGQLDPAVERHG